MREIFLGDLSQLKLFDVLKTLLTEKKTGALTIKGRDNGDLYLEEGNIVHAKTTHAVGEEAFLTMMGWKMGKFTIKPDVQTKEKTITIPPEQLLLKWSYRKQEWDKIREILPSPGVILRLSMQQGAEEKNIKSEQWNVLALTNGMRTVSEIAEALGWDEFKTSKIVYQLMKGGLLVKAEESKPVAAKKRVGEGFFVTLENELKRVMGPMAMVMVEDKLAEFGETRDSFPHDQAGLFVELLSEEIPSDQKKKEFARVIAAMLPAEDPRKNP